MMLFITSGSEVRHTQVLVQSSSSLMGRGLGSCRPTAVGRIGSNKCSLPAVYHRSETVVVKRLNVCDFVDLDVFGSSANCLPPALRTCIKHISLNLSVAHNEPKMAKNPDSYVGLICTE